MFYVYYHIVGKDCALVHGLKFIVEVPAFVMHVNV